MSKHMYRLTILSVTLWLASIAPRSAYAQDPFRLPEDFLFEKVDEWWLQHDEARLQNDINRGDARRVNRDLNRIQWDERRIWYDRRRIRRDLFLPPGPWVPRPQPIPMDATLIPHPQYPGYGYYPSKPTQLYQIPQPVPVLNPAPGGGSSSRSSPASTADTTTRAQVSVVIRNAEQTGVDVNYVVDDVAYKAVSGGLQRLVVGPSSTIHYDRGGTFGVQRYGLSGGVYEFRSSDTGWALVKLRPAP